MKRTITILIVTIVTALSIVSAQPKERLSKNELQNLVMGINSENPGLKRSSIYFAGYYKIENLVDELTNVMVNDEDANTRILAALALYEIGNEEVLNDMLELTQRQSTDIKVRRMVNAIYVQWKADNENLVSVVR
jgi:HEAT repeat protein